jgi:hypothetical protein
MWFISYREEVHETTKTVYYLNTVTDEHPLVWLKRKLMNENVTILFWEKIEYELGMDAINWL